jgi:glycoside/pentoside/hexuronide:cation symporter, GPH family
MLASLLITAVGPLVVFVDNKIDANRMLMAAIVFGILAVCCYISCYKLTVERIVSPENKGPKVSMSKTMKGLSKNKPLMWILAASLLFMVNTLLVQTVNTYLFKDYFSNAAALSLAGLSQTVTAFIAMPLVKPLVVKFGKKEVASGGIALAAIVYLTLFFLNDISAIPFVMISALGMFGFAFLNLVIWAFVTDVIDYHEYLTGLREDATVYSIYSMARKIGQAIAGGIGGFAIASVGYNAALAQQTQDALNGIHGLATLVPAVIYIVIFIILVFLYPLNKNRTKQLTLDLAEKRKTH